MRICLSIEFEKSIRHVMYVYVAPFQDHPLNNTLVVIQLKAELSAFNCIRIRVLFSGVEREPHTCIGKSP